MPEYTLTQTAQDQLNEFWEYIAQDDPDAAQVLVEAAFSAFEKLARQPYMGKARDFGNPELSGQRCWVIPEFRNYLIFYFPTESGVIISRVYHGARDLEELMGGDLRGE